MEIEAITGLIPIHLHLHKLSGQYQLYMSTLSQNHMIKSLLKRKHTSLSTSLSFLEVYDFQAIAKNQEFHC